MQRQTPAQDPKHVSRYGGVIWKHVSLIVELNPVLDNRKER